ncbi:MAG: hypothetical protein WA496_03865 [Candidatus Udaeobacter sp.]
MAASRYRLHLAWVGIVYITVVATVLYPALHEGFDARITLWNCLPPTLGLIVISTALGKSSRRIVVSAVFALLTAAVTTFFSAAWFFTPLDLDPHSATTKLVFIFAPLFSLGLAIIASGVAWIVARST